MSFDLQTRTCFDKQLPGVNEILVQAVTVAAVIDLGAGAEFDSFGLSSGEPLSAQAAGAVVTSGSPSGAAQFSGGPAVIAQPATGQRGYLQTWIEIWVDSGGGDLGLVAGPRSADVSAGNAPVLATTGAAGTAGNCSRIAAGTWERFFVTPDKRFLGVVSSSGTATIRIHRSSRRG